MGVILYAALISWEIYDDVTRFLFLLVIVRRVTPLDFDSIRFQSVPFHSLRPSEWCRLFGSHHETCRNVASFRTERLANGSHVARSVQPCSRHR